MFKFHYKYREYDGEITEKTSYQTDYNRPMYEKYVSRYEEKGDRGLPTDWFGPISIEEACSDREYLLKWADNLKVKYANRLKDLFEREIPSAKTAEWELKRTFYMYGGLDTCPVSGEEIYNRLCEGVWVTMTCSYKPDGVAWRRYTRGTYGIVVRPQDVKNYKGRRIYWSKDIMYFASRKEALNALYNDDSEFNK